MKLTRKGFKAKAEAAFLRQNPGATVEWISAAKVEYPTGVKGWAGKFAAAAPGYKPRVMLADGDDMYVMVR